MLIVPFVNPHHFNPIASFYPEWSAVALSLAALTQLLRRAVLARLEVPKIALLPLGLGALVLVQWEKTGSEKTGSDPCCQRKRPGDRHAT